MVASPLAMSFITASGVAPVCPSTAVSAMVRNGKPGVGHVVICTGNEMSRNARPANAGLKRLQPSPPKVIFTTPIANKAPITTIHNGMLAGRLNASNKPVRMAEPSVTVGRPSRSRYLPMTHSKNTHDATDTAVTAMAPRPKK